MGDIFYTIGLFLALGNFFNLLKITKINKTNDWIKKYTKVTGKSPLKSDFKNDNYQWYISWSFSSVLTFFWMCLGILTNSWIIFILLIFSNLLLTRINKISQTNSINTFIEFVKISVNTIVIFYLVINHFHLHYNTQELLYKYLI